MRVGHILSLTHSVKYFSDCLGSNVCTKSMSVFQPDELNMCIKGMSKFQAEGLKMCVMSKFQPNHGHRRSLDVISFQSRHVARLKFIYA